MRGRSLVRAGTEDEISVGTTIMREINVRNEIQIHQMYRDKKWIKGRMGYAGFLSLGVYLLSACHTNTQYHVYQSVTGGEGWQKTDSVVFELPPEVPAGTYQM